MLSDDNKCRVDYQSKYQETWQDPFVQEIFNHDKIFVTNLSLAGAPFLEINLTESLLINLYRKNQNFAGE